jgi:hypothetical protein
LYDFLGHVSFSTLPTLFAHPDFKIKNTNCYRAISQVFTIKSNMIASFKPLNLLFLTLPWSSTCISGLSIANTCMSEWRSHSFNLGIKHFGAVAVQVHWTRSLAASTHVFVWLLYTLGPQIFQYKTSWDCFSIGTQNYSHLLYRTSSLKNVVSIVTQFELLRCLFSAFKRSISRVPRDLLAILKCDMLLCIDCTTKDYLSLVS